MKTLLTIKQQESFLSVNREFKTINHKWSSRGYGNSKIIDDMGCVISKANGCGYDRFGTVIGSMIEVLFPKEINKLAKRFCKKGPRNSTRKCSSEFYGLFYNAKEKTAYLDGGCGYSCMYKVLNAIGFELSQIAESERSNNGEVFYSLSPVSTHNKKYILKGL